VFRQSSLTPHIPSAALSSQTGSAFSMGPQQAKSAFMDFELCSHTAACSQSLPF